MLTGVFQAIKNWTSFRSSVDEYDLVKGSDYFDTVWYKAHANLTGDVDPVKHFLRYGSSYPPSQRFDSTWYLHKYPDVALAGVNPLVHYLKHGRLEGRMPMPSSTPDKNTGQASLTESTSPVESISRYESVRSPGQRFDPVWYLNEYPDVADARIDPLVHYLTYGRAEGRLPMFCYTSIWDYHLWSGLHEFIEGRLKSLISDPGVVDFEKLYAVWSLARWHAWNGNLFKAKELLFQHQDLRAPFPDYLGVILLAVDLAQRCGAEDDARVLLSHWLEHEPSNPSLCLAQSNLLRNEGPGKIIDWLDSVNRPFLQVGVPPLEVNDWDLGPTLDALHISLATESILSRGPLVSVIVPVHNSGSTIRTALYSLFNQTWHPLEVLVVDDASADDTWSQLQQLSEECPPHISFRLLQNETNQGAYVSRNRALSLATGEFITCHDSDDWSHTHKIANQVQALLDDPQAVATVSHWVRVTTEMHFGHWRPQNGWVERNVSSLMFRRHVFSELGYWDRVSIAADTEYYYRIISTYGVNAIQEVLPGVPLSFGRVSPESLSQRASTHEVSQYGGIRKDYMDAAHGWHKRQGNNSHLYLESEPTQRPFYAPEAIRRDAIVYQKYRLTDKLLESALFDSVWYRYRYPDLIDSTVDPFQHFLTQKTFEGRDPGPLFSMTGYACFYGLENTENAVSHYLTHGRSNGYLPRPIFEGDKICRVGCKTILLCAHQSAEQVFGAERSLVDILKGLVMAGLNVVVVLPGVGNEDYLAEIRKYAIAVAIVPFGWWMKCRPDYSQTIEFFSRLLDDYNVDRVYLNTLVLHEPALAAKSMKIPVSVHVHELPEGDLELCKLLNSDPDEIVLHTLDYADQVITNSRLVHDYLLSAQARLLPDATERPISFHIVPNTADIEQLQKIALPPYVTGHSPFLTVGMISSNLPKKGLDDFIKVAKILESKAPTVQFKLIGPQNQHTDKLLPRNEKVQVRKNLTLEGYVSDPEKALESLDVVLNLSHCKETFGRTILEAMAAGRATICYEWGGLPELVVPEETGVLVPFRDIDSVADSIIAMVNNSTRLKEMGLAGRERAVNNFGRDQFNASLIKASQYW